VGTVVRNFEVCGFERQVPGEEAIGLQALEVEAFGLRALGAEFLRGQLREEKIPQGQ
jgi:hypothetical protein